MPPSTSSRVLPPPPLQAGVDVADAMLDLGLGVWEPGGVAEPTTFERELAATPEYVAVDREYAADPWRWACEQVVTVDEAVQRARPWEPSPEVEDIFTILDHEPMVAFPKSRRMRVTWAVALHVLHGIRYKPHRFDLWMSRVEESAAAVVDSRMAAVELRLREPALRRPFERWKTNRGQVGRIRFLGSESAVWAMAQGADVFRSYTVSRLVIDESEFQEQAPAVLTAALPLVEKGAQIVVLSSSGGPFGVLAAICKSVGFVRFK